MESLLLQRLLWPRYGAARDLKLVAQGTTERRSGCEPFRLIGAAGGDLLVVVVDDVQGPPKVFQGSIRLEAASSLVQDVDIDIKPAAYAPAQATPRVVVRPHVPDVGSGDEALDTAPDEHDQLPIEVSIELIFAASPPPVL